MSPYEFGRTPNATALGDDYRLITTAIAAVRSRTIYVALRNAHTETNTLTVFRIAHAPTANILPAETDDNVDGRRPHLQWKKG